MIVASIRGYNNSMTQMNALDEGLCLKGILRDRYDDILENYRYSVEVI